MSNYPRPKLITGSTITRPADTTAYTSGDLVANSTTAGSVTPITFTGVVRNTGYRARIHRAGLFTSNATITNGAFRLHLFTATPTVANGDNGAIAVATNITSYLGFLDATLGIAGAQGGAGWGFVASPTAPGGFIDWLSVSSTGLIGLLEARGAYTPASAETFTPVLSVDQY